MQIHKSLTKLSILVVILLMSCVAKSPTPAVVSKAQTESNVSPSKEQSKVEVKPYKASKERFFDLLHTKIELGFDWEKEQALGKAQLTLVPYFYPQNTLTLDMKGFEIHDLGVYRGEAYYPLEYVYDGYQAQITLDKVYQRTDTLKIQVSYTASPGIDKNTGEKTAIDDKGLYFINPRGEVTDFPRQIWTQGEPEANSWWFPTIDAPNERSTQELLLTVPDTMVSVSNGKLIHQKKTNNGFRVDHWRMDQPHAPYLFAFAIGDFAVVRDSWGGIPLAYYTDQKYGETVEEVFKRTPEMMTYFSELLGVKFPWPKYDQVVVREFVSGAMENTTVSIFYDELNMRAGQLDDYHWDEIIAHELFHQWFGDLVTTESWANLPLNEAFANYSEYLWLSHYYGEATAMTHHISEMQAYFTEAEDKKVDLIRFDHELPDDMFDSHSYAKGGRVLHMLRNEVGDEAFFASLEHYLKSHSYKSVEIHDLRLAFEQITGRDLNWFFNQWFLAAGHPELKISYEYRSDSVLVKISQNQDLTKYPLYRLPSELSIYMGAEVIKKPILITKQQETFSIPVSRKPSLVIWDEDFTILAAREEQKNEVDFINQYKQSKAVIRQIEALDSLQNYPYQESIKSIVIDALNSADKELRVSALNYLLSTDVETASLFESKILEIAEKDSDNMTRSTAIYLLEEIDAIAYATLFKALINDPSELVSATALASYLSSDPADAAVYVARYENSEQIDALIAIAEYYINATADVSDWYQSTIDRVGSANAYYLVNLYGEYLSAQSKAIQEKAAVFLKELALNGANSYVRFMATQSIYGLFSVENRDQLLMEIYQKESDLGLKSFYKSMGIDSLED